MKTRHCLPALLFAVAITPASADPICDQIVRSMLALTDEPSIRQQMFTFKDGREQLLVEVILLRDGMHMREADKKDWTRLPMNAQARRAAALKALETMPISGCSGPRDIAAAGPAISAYEFNQVNPIATSGRSRASIWVGKADGKLRRIVLEDGSYQTVEYGRFSAPAP